MYSGTLLCWQKPFIIFVSLCLFFYNLCVFVSFKVTPLLREQGNSSGVLNATKVKYIALTNVMHVHQSNNLIVDVVI